MIELTEQAGLADPEWVATPYDVTVRFRPTQYVAPTRVGHDLSPLQRQVLAAIARSGPMPLGRILEGLPEPVPRRTVQDNLKLLRQLGLVKLVGSGSGATWMIGEERR